MTIPGFAAEASLNRMTRQRYLGRYEAGGGGRITPALVGRWHVPFTDCEINCIEVCTRFCAPTGWDCCGWETRCAVSCSGRTVFTNY